MSSDLYVKRHLRPTGFLGLATCVLTLAVVAAAGDLGARVGAAFGGVGLILGLGAVARHLRAEHADDPVQPSWRRCFAEAAQWTGPAWFGIAAFVALSYLATAHDAPRVADAVAAGTASVALAATFLTIGRDTWGDGVEREQYLRATSVAFSIVMVGAASYGVFETAVSAPKLSMWWVYGTGMLLWATLTSVYQRRLG